MSLRKKIIIFKLRLHEKWKTEIFAFLEDTRGGRWTKKMENKTKEDEDEKEIKTNFFLLCGELLLANSCYTFIRLCRRSVQIGLETICRPRKFINFAAFGQGNVAVNLQCIRCLTQASFVSTQRKSKKSGKQLWLMLGLA